MHHLFPTYQESKLMYVEIILIPEKRSSKGTISLSSNIEEEDTTTVIKRREEFKVLRYYMRHECYYYLDHQIYLNQNNLAGVNSTSE